MLIMIDNLVLIQALMSEEVMMFVLTLLNTINVVKLNDMYNIIREIN